MSELKDDNGSDVEMEPNNNKNGQYRIPVQRYRGNNVNTQRSAQLNAIRRNQAIQRQNVQATAMGGAFLLPNSVVPHTPNRRGIRRDQNNRNNQLVPRRRQQITNDIYTSGLWMKLPFTRTYVFIYIFLNVCSKMD